MHNPIVAIWAGCARGPYQPYIYYVVFTSNTIQALKTRMNVIKNLGVGTYGEISFKILLKGFRAEANINRDRLVYDPDTLLKPRTSWVDMRDHSNVDSYTFTELTKEQKAIAYVHGDHIVVGIEEDYPNMGDEVTFHRFSMLFREEKSARRHPEDYDWFSEAYDAKYRVQPEEISGRLHAEYRLFRLGSPELDDVLDKVMPGHPRVWDKPSMG